MARRKKASRRQRKKKTIRSNFANALRRLKSLKASEQRQAMNMANNSFIRQFCKKLKTMKHAKLPHKSKRVLQKYKKQLRQLMRAKSMSKRRHILTQKGGGFLKDLLLAVPVVGNVLHAIDTI